MHIKKEDKQTEGGSEEEFFTITTEHVPDSTGNVERQWLSKQSVHPTIQTHTWGIQSIENWLHA